MFTIEEFLKSKYDIEVLNYNKLQVGVASNTYFIETVTDRYILKNPCKSEINHPEIEVRVCELLLNKGISVSEFIKNNEGSYITYIDGEIYHLQKYIIGINFGLNEAPEWLMKESASLLARIHHVLATYPKLPEGMGENFFNSMTPQRVMESYRNSINIANSKGDREIVEDLKIRIELLNKFPYQTIALKELSCGNTHGDFVISQLIAKDNKIAGVIDWTSACIHPYVWEIFRSFVYAEPSCKDGNISIDKLLSYVKEYLKYHNLPHKDIVMMPVVFYYQIAVCDYYGQYYYSTADNRHIILHQARFSTNLMKWFNENMNILIEALESI